MFSFGIILACVILKAYAYNCTSCPTSLKVLPGSQPISQYPGTNQYNCSQITVRCANPNSSGSVSLQFYYGGNGSTYTLKCGIDYENVMCSTEGYQWVQINGQTYKVDSVNCSYPPRNYCNASTAAVPTTTSTPRAVQTTLKAPNCNSCPRNVTVVGTSAPIAQFQGVNQWNCSDVVLRCSNPTGGRVTLYFLLNGKGATYANGNGTLYETINCSTEGYQWVNINGTGVPVNQVSCATS